MSNGGESEPWSVDSIFQGIVDFFSEDILGNIVWFYEFMISSRENQLIMGGIFSAIPYLWEFFGLIRFLII